MEVHPDLSKVIEFAAINHDLTENIAETRRMLEEAKSFLLAFQWCKEIKRVYVGFVYPEILAVFLFNISPAREDVDEWVWVIVGDLPPAYISCENSPNPATALNGYLGALEEWIDAIRSGKPTTGLIPVNTPSTPEYAELLEKRVRFIDERILSRYQDDLKDTRHAR